MKQFDQLYYINLEYRVDLYEKINKVINTLEFDRNKVTRINAIKKDNGAYGCALSHIMVLEDAKKNGYDKILILEDDFTPFSYYEMINKISKFLEHVPNWDVLMLSTHHSNVNMESLKSTNIDNVLKVVRANSTIAYAVQNHYFDKLLEVFNESANELSKIEFYSEPCTSCIDVNWYKLQPNDNWYVFVPFLGREYPNYSDVQNKIIDHSS